jgi:hypothetical protein
MRRFWLGLALVLVVGACVVFALMRRHPHTSAEALASAAAAPGGTVAEGPVAVATPDDDARGHRRRRRREPKHEGDQDLSAWEPALVASAPADLSAWVDPTQAPWPVGAVPGTASRSARVPVGAPPGAAFEVSGSPAAPLSGLRWLTGARPSPEPAMLVLVFLGVGERDTPGVVPPLVARVHAMAARDVAVVGLAKACADYLAFDADSVRWLHEQALDLPVAVLTAALERRYDVDRVPLAQVVVRGAVVWRGQPDALDEAELTRLHGWVDAVAER